MVAGVVDWVVSPVHLQVIDSIITGTVGNSHLNLILHIATVHLSFYNSLKNCAVYEYQSGENDK